MFRQMSKDTERLCREIVWVCVAYCVFWPTFSNATYFLKAPSKCYYQMFSFYRTFLWPYISRLFYIEFLSKMMNYTFEAQVFPQSEKYLTICRMFANLIVYQIYFLICSYCKISLFPFRSRCPFLNLTDCIYEKSN